MDTWQNMFLNGNIISVGWWLCQNVGQLSGSDKHEELCFMSNLYFQPVFSDVANKNVIHWDIGMANTFYHAEIEMCW